MFAIFFCFAHLDRGAWDVGGAEDNGVLNWRDNGDIERHLAAIAPVPNEDVCRSGKGSGDNAWHFFHRVEARALCFIEDMIPNSVMSAAPNAMIVTAVHGVVAVRVFIVVAVDGRARSWLYKMDAEAVAHRRGKRAGVEMEVETWGRNCVAPVASMRKSKGVEASLIPDYGGSEELRARVGIDGGREGVLSKPGR